LQVEACTTSKGRWSYLALGRDEMKESRGTDRC